MYVSSYMYFKLFLRQFVATRFLAYIMLHLRAPFLEIQFTKKNTFCICKKYIYKVALGSNLNVHQEKKNVDYIEVAEWIDTDL